MSLIDQNISPEERHYLMDATLDVVPDGNFYQLLIIHIEYKNDVSYYLYESNFKCQNCLYAKSINLFSFILILMFKDIPRFLHSHDEKNNRSL